MTSCRHLVSPPRLSLLLLPWLILAAMLGVSWLIWDHERQSIQQERRLQFDFALHETVSRIEQHATAYEQMLRGVQGLFATTGLTNRSALGDYVETLQLDANFSGIRSLAVVEWVTLPRKTAHIAAMRRLGLADYSILPDGRRDAYAPITQREAHLASDRDRLGSDLWIDPVRRRAMESARDSGMARMTGKVRLFVDTEAEASPGVVIYLPIFAKGQAHDSIAQRRAHLVGWVSLSFHMSDFMASLFGQQAPGLTLAIYDDVVATGDTLLYRSADDTGQQPPASATLSANEYMVVAGHPWMLTMGTTPEFTRRFDRNATTVIAVTGIGLSFSLALLVWLMLTGRAHALRLAASMTEELRHVAQHDPLTGLPNRTLFSDRVNQELARAKRQNGRFAVIFIDLDNFKPVNDNFGHEIGDLLLQQVARRIEASIRASDTVSRIGGDEFVVLMSGLTEGDAALGLAEKIRQTVRHPYVINAHTLLISCSIGVAIYPNNGSDEPSLTKSADQAMYRAKAEGRDRFQRAA
jgi:diguanylate cyclase